MSNYPRGSEWRRWDLHVHTPASYLSNEFGDSEQDSTWNNYIQSLFKKALEKNIAAIGITDYFSVDGYEKVLSYQKNRNILQELNFNIEEIKRIQDILILPNIELRLKCIVGTNRVNFHVIFSNNVALSDIRENFLENLTFSYEAEPDNKDYKYKLKKSNLENLGNKLIKEHDSFKGKPPINIGAMNAVVDDAEISKTLSETACFKNSYIIASPVDEDISALSWNSQEHQTRKILYQKSHCFFSSNQKTKEFGLGLKHKTQDAYINEFKTLKPCIHGSDAHTIEKLFVPDKDNFCWIKADPTFDGLKQILYEPSERVLISPTKPETKSDYFVIDKIKFNHNNFQQDPIFFNDKLNCIIGGKSTGKSILLQNMARAIDKEEVKKSLDKANNKTLEVEDISVFWRDGNIENRKIIYIPQTYLNKLSDEKEETTEIDMWILDILLKQKDFKEVYDRFNIDVKELKSNVSKRILDFMEIFNEIMQLSNEQKEVGDKIGIESEIKKLKEEKDKIAQASEIREEDLKLYDNALQEITKIEKVVTNLTSDSLNIFPIEALLETKSISNNLQEENIKKIQDIQNKLFEDAKNKWIEQKNHLLNEISNNISQQTLEKNTHQAIIDTYKPLIEQNKAIIELTKKIQEEQTKLEKVITYETKINSKIKEKDVSLAHLISIPKKYELLHQVVIDSVNGMSISNKNLEFYSELQFRKEAFIEKFLLIYHNANAEVKKITNPEVLTKENYSDSIIRKILEETLTKALPLKTNYNFESAYRDILDDWYNTSFKVKMDGDTINMMSPGKKALVLLKVLISLADSRCPILIDQPEDDLDNRSIYKDLAEFIKEKKKERQIIVVTHNANIVVGADAEEVVVANQNGYDCLNKKARFEYRSGSIENTSPLFDEEGNIEKGILNEKGIQEHICDILEGGEKAFELRKKKYKI